MKPFNVPVEEFLRPFFDPADKICLRVFADRKDGVVFKGMKLETTLAQMNAMVPMLREQNALMRGIYFVVNAGGHEDAEITRINAQFMECDDIPLEEQQARIEAFPLEPSIVVKTRKSLHMAAKCGIPILYGNATQSIRGLPLAPHLPYAMKPYKTPLCGHSIGSSTARTRSIKSAKKPCGNAAIPLGWRSNWLRCARNWRSLQGSCSGTSASMRMWQWIRASTSGNTTSMKHGSMIPSGASLRRRRIGKP